MYTHRRPYPFKWSAALLSSSLMMLMMKALTASSRLWNLSLNMVEKIEKRNGFINEFLFLPDVSTGKAFRACENECLSSLQRLLGS
ncbi:unnamed protein product [Caenorhabditis nigoni]